MRFDSRRAKVRDASSMPDGQVLLEVHMDDAHSCGPTLASKKNSEHIKERLSVKHAYIHEYGSATQYQHLRREPAATSSRILSTWRRRPSAWA